VESLGPAPGLEVSDVRQVPGRGVRGRCEGREITVGSADFVADHAEVSAEFLAAAGTVASDGLSPVLVAVDGHTVAVAGMGDPLRPETRATVAALARDGWRLEVLSGDHPDVVRAVAERAGLDPGAAYGSVPPEAKAERVAAAVGASTVVMVGDGVNDAAALASATVGVAVHGGAEAALAAADVYLARPGIDGLADLVEGARRTLTVIRRNLVFSLTYNVVAVSLAVTGHMHPLLAAVLMPLSSITVVVSSYRARTFEARGR
jgi:P-type E1-E2 ATPase